MKFHKQLPDMCRAMAISGRPGFKGCLLLLCGLPGAGKTRLSGKICAYFNQNHWSCGNKCVIVPVCYDDILTEDLERRLIGTVKSHRADIDADSYRADTDTDSHKADTDTDCHRADTDRDSYRADTDTDSHKADTDTESHRADTDRDSYRADTDTDSQRANTDRDSYRADTDTDSHRADTDTDPYRADTDRDSYKADTETDCFNKAQELASGWKSYRRSIVNCVDSLMATLVNRAHNTTDKPDRVEEEIWTNFKSQVSIEMMTAATETPLEHVVIIIDDNMYYSSMRYQYFQLARKYSFGFCQAHVSCDVEESLRRNAQRVESVQPHVISDMAQRFEAPDPERNSWERNSVTFINSTDMGGVMALIDTGLENPVEAVEEDTEGKEESRVICSQSVLYQMDQILRKVVTQNIQHVTGTLTKEELKAFAKRMNSIKTILYSELKAGSILIPQQCTENITDAVKDRTSPVYSLMEQCFQDKLNGKPAKDISSQKR